MILLSISDLRSTNYESDSRVEVLLQTLPLYNLATLNQLMEGIFQSSNVSIMNNEVHQTLQPYHLQLLNSHPDTIQSKHHSCSEDAKIPLIYCLPQVWVFHSGFRNLHL